ncbi:uncharacterized protein RAG0_05161 [Rhynchosporium agropyri]|uniref:EKC/KEOPS complex subunit BUD32 n=1 Tax=Rhynchosporium agropyri TaxID=914238 RepID=A0A1E1KBZ1_9HELO|nr:uncharacterized protein RAG0_05161 [Rhynchosporium agropyri]
MVLSPKVIISVALVENDYSNLPFQPEKRLSTILEYETESKPTTRSKNDERESSSTSSTCYTTKSRRAQPPDRRPTVRRHSATTSSVLSSTHHNNIFYATDIPSANLITGHQITHIHLGNVIHQAGKLSSGEADCYIMQLISGLAYLHSIDITHRDISPRNLLLTSNGALKIANFNSSEQVKHAIRFFAEKTFDGKAVDMWAAGIVYMEMRGGKTLWEKAAEGADEDYDGYLRDRVGLWDFWPVENLRNKHCRSVVRSLLDPSPGKRMTASIVLISTWSLETGLCAAITPGEETEKP